MTNTIKEFLQEWKVNAREYYEGMAKEMATADFKEFSEEYSRAQRELFAMSGNKENFDKFLDKEVEKKEKAFIKRIEKKAGTITDAENLTIGKDGNINGKVIGEKATVEVETILAGGYNIQKLHYRILVK